MIQPLQGSIVRPNAKPPLSKQQASKNFGAVRKVVQPKLPISPQAKNSQKVPPIYRPFREPRCLQTSSVLQRLQLRIALPTVNAIKPKMRQPTVMLPIGPRTGKKTIQATKVFPNLHPGAALPMDRSNVFKLDTVTDQYRLRRLNSHFVTVPNQRYNFVTTTKGELLLHQRYRHPSLAEGQQVLYAGEAMFNNGKLDWWSNASGHYQPDDDYAKQASLPMERFFTYQQVLKGEHKKKLAQPAQKELNLTRAKR